MKELRPAIIRAHEKGKGVCEIAQFLDIEPSTVSRAIMRFEETGSNENRKREKTARSRRNIHPALGLLCVEHSRRKSVCETPPECGILEASFEEGMERNHLENFDQDRGQLSEATEGLHGCKRRTFKSCCCNCYLLYSK